MNVAALAPVAMILPLPVPPRAPDDAVRFIDMKRYASFFADLDRAFRSLATASRGGAFRMAPKAHRPRLVVHEVGDFVASFVPSRADFDRLDPRFRLSEGVWRALPQPGSPQLWMKNHASSANVRGARRSVVGASYRPHDLR